MKHWLAVVVVVAACGKGSNKSDEPPVGVAHLKQHDEPTKGSAAAPPPTDPACVEKADKFGIWLQSFELERSSYEIDFGYKLQKISDPPRPVPHEIDAVEITASHIEAFDATEANHADSKLGEKPTQKAVEDRLATIHGMADKTPDRLRFDIDEKATWKDVARVSDAAIKAGYKEALFVFTATSQLQVPAGVEEWTSKTEDVDAASKKIEELQKQCSAWESAIFRHKPDPDELKDALAWANEISAAFKTCNCAANIDDAKTQLFKEARWHQAVPRTAVLVGLNEGGKPVTSPGKALWSEAHKALVDGSLSFGNGPTGQHESPPALVKLVAK